MTEKETFWVVWTESLDDFDGITHKRLGNQELAEQKATELAARSPIDVYILKAVARVERIVTRIEG